jgi:hypothetical protein
LRSSPALAGQSEKQPAARRATPAQLAGRGLARASDYRFGIVLVVITSSAVFQLAAPETDWARFVTILLQGGALLLSLHAAHVHRHIRHVADIAVAVIVIGSAIPLLGPGDVGIATPRFLALALVLLAPPAIVIGLIRQLRDDGQVTVQSMFAGLCLYMLIAMAFALVYGMIDALGSRPFFAADREETISTFLYFSFSTMTTTGYGDFVAGTPVGRAVCTFEALTGQIYLVTVVALIVGSLGARRQRESASRSAPR